MFGHSPVFVGVHVLIVVFAAVASFIPATTVATAFMVPVKHATGQEKQPADANQSKEIFIFIFQMRLGFG